MTPPRPQQQQSTNPELPYQSQLGGANKQKKVKNTASPTFPYPSDGPKLRRRAAILSGHRDAEDKLGQEARALLSVGEGPAEDEEVQVSRLVGVLWLHLHPLRVVPALFPHLKNKDVARSNTGTVSQPAVRTCNTHGTGEYQGARYKRRVCEYYKGTKTLGKGAGRGGACVCASRSQRYKADFYGWRK